MSINAMELIFELRQLADKFSEGWHDGIKIDASDIMLLSQSASFIEAIVEAEKQEPVAWMWDVYNGAGYTSRGIGFQQTDIPFAKHTPLYTHPPKREWVEIEKSDMPDGDDPMFDHLYFLKGMVYASEVLKRKNT